MTTTRLPFQTEMRAAAMTLLRDFRQEFDLPLQVYEARPTSIAPPCAFVERMHESIVFDGLRQRTVRVDLVILWGTFDNKDAAEQRDAFVDAFVDYCTDRYHAASGNTVLEPRAVEDDPNYIPDWLPPERQRSYFSTTFVLEGFAGGY